MTELNKLVQKSNSNEIVKKVSENMEGKTFHHHYHILYDIRTLLGKEKKIYTEIGTYCGGSLSLILQHSFDTECFCIDPLHVLKNQKDILYRNILKFNKNNYKVNISQNFSNDKNFIEKLIKSGFKTDILFIDGDHSYTGVIQDFHNYEQFVNKNGYIIFDDYFDYKSSPDVKKAVDDIVLKLDLNKYEIIGIIPNYHDSFCNGSKIEYLNEYIIKKK